MSGSTISEASDDRKGIQSIEIGGQLLRVLSRHAGPMLLRDVAREAGMAAAKAHPYLVSFCKIRLVEQDLRTGRYQLGALALRLGLAGLAQSPALRRAEEALGPFKQKVQHTVALAVWGQLGPTIVQMSAVDFPLETNLRVGSVMSMVSTATGRVFATYMQPNVTERLLEIELQRLALASADEELAKASFMKEIAEIRARGMARAMGNPIPGINALAAPILNANGRLDLVALVFGSEENFDARWGGSIATALADYCSSISRD
ncbi:DNA-binding IclR family transcriptional regulator [Variovorax paradoxus]|uniref:DNA-binding IclR family transcriptional regulator n=1 Tax=Variovorax paradoxus TaxID=34073 RepID=A0AAW8EEQ3_VARPD|nr:helix-turn-helix domain-containing protein [Variovorax paradoxus]MDP9971420.1 DNA-binding IclR family transcriptional regulator [Variovorax paradoxus]